MTYNPDQLSPLQAAFLAAYRVTGNITGAASAAGMNRGTHYLWMRTDDNYVSAFADAEEEATDYLEQAARDRAVHGVRKLMFTRDGQPIIDPATGEQYYEMMYSDNLLTLLLRAHRPDKFRHNTTHEHTGPGGGPLQVDHSLRQLALMDEGVAEDLCDALEQAAAVEDGDTSGGE